MNFRTSKIALGRTACLIALLLGAGGSLSYAQDGCPNPPPNTEATPGPTPTLAPPAWDAGLGIGVVPDSDGTQATTSGMPPEGQQPLFDGRMTSPEDQTDDEADPAKVQVGKRLSCAVEDASDSDHWSQADGLPCKKDPDGIAGDGVHYSWSATGGSFEGPLDGEGHPTLVSSVQGQGAWWVAPGIPGKYTITCTIDDTPTPADDPSTTDIVETGSRDDPAITRSCVITVYSFSLRFLESEVAAGNIDNAMHQATYEISASDGKDPVADVDVEEPTIHSGGLGPSNSPNILPSAKCEKGDEKTNALGKATGIFTSGNRTQATTIIYEGATASINQVWNSEEEPWTFDPYIDYETPLLTGYNMSYSRGVISGHPMHFENLAISGWEWDDFAGEDWDDDGIVDGDYVYASFLPSDSDLSGWELYEPLSEWSDVEEIEPGSYESNQIIHWDDFFVVTNIVFDIYDDTTYDEDGAS